MSPRSDAAFLAEIERVARANQGAVGFRSPRTRWDRLRRRHRLQPVVVKVEQVYEPGDERLLVALVIYDPRGFELCRVVLGLDDLLTLVSDPAPAGGAEGPAG